MGKSQRRKKTQKLNTVESKKPVENRKIPLISLSTSKSTEILPTPILGSTSICETRVYLVMKTGAREESKTTN